MRRVEAVVGADAIREINLERALAPGGRRGARHAIRQRAVERARQLVERVKRLESEQGRRAKERRASRPGRSPPRPGRSTASAWSTTTLDAGTSSAAARRRTSPTAGSQRRRGRGPRQRAGREGAARRGVQSKRLVVAGVTAPELLEPAAAIVGGGAGGKPGLAFSGGPKRRAPSTRP